MVSTTSCPRCGAENPAEANFCSTCGYEFDESPHDLTQRHAVVAVDLEEMVTLVVTRGALAGSRYAVGGPRTTIGRHPESGVFLDDVSVSRRHAEVSETEHGLVITDTGSLNGTYINGERIAEAVALVEGDQLQIGKFKLVVVNGARHGDD